VSKSTKKRSDSYAKTRVLSKHIKAAKLALSEIPARVADGADADEIAKHIATEVLTAYDDAMKYVVITDDNIGFGPYPSRKAANLAVEKGNCTYRLYQRVIVIPMKPSPRKSNLMEYPKQPEPEGKQLALWELPPTDDLGNPIPMQQVDEVKD